MKKRSTTFLLCLFCLIISSCQSNHKYFPNQLPEAHIPIVRFDSALLNLPTDTLQPLTPVQHLYREYPTFMPFFVENILGIPPADTAYLASVLPQFLTDTLYGFQETNAEVKRQFAKINDIQEPINQSFARIHYLFPEMPLPRIYLFISGFNASILFLDSDPLTYPSPTDIAVGVDMYLGSDYPLYNHVVYNYQKQTMRKECIPLDVVSAYLFHNFPFNSTKSRLLENMIYRGKIMYLLSLIFDEETEAEVMGYTTEQMNWCQRYEADIWNHIMDRHDLFQTNPEIIASYLNDGPFTAVISQDSPARVGTWIGWKICESYLKHNPNISLQTLLAEPDAQKILENSHYRP